MSIITYHRATEHDCRLLAETRVAFAIELKGDQPQEAKDKLKQQMTAYFQKAIRENSCISYLAKINGELAGIGSVHLREMPGNFHNVSGKWGYIMNMYTLPAFRRKGICTGILNALIEAAKQEGYTAFELHASVEGEYVYVQNGFMKHKEPTYRKFV